MTRCDKSAVQRYRQVWFWLLLWMVFVPGVQAATDCNTVTEIPVSECRSLLELYHSTDGPNWKNNRGWIQTNTPCSWFGVTCDAGHVTKIELFDDGNALDDVYGNGLKDQIPDLNLPNLLYLELSFNQLSGSIPDFSNLPNLMALSLNANQLKGQIPDLNLPNLLILGLINNQLNGNLPNFSKLPNLELLALGNNQLSGSIPDFSNLPNLAFLGLNGNQLSGSIPNFTAFSLANLQVAFFNNNCGLIAYDEAQESVLNSKDPDWQTQNPNCSVSTVTDSTVTDCNAVTEIPVSECQSLLELYNSTDGPNWRHHTGWNRTNTPCSWFGITCDAGHVTGIKLGGMFVDVTPDEDEDTSPPGNSLGLKGQIPDLNLPKLIILSLNHNHLSGNIPNFSNLPNLTSLSLNGNQLSGSIPDFSNLPNLTVLSLGGGYRFAGGNQLSGTIPNFSNLPNLTTLFLGYNQLSGIIPNFTAFSLADLKDVSFDRNCGLTAYDSAQESVLNSKDPGWQTRNPNCSLVTNQPPIADYYATPANGQAPLTVTLDASPSSDADGSIVSYQWSINGQTLSGPTVSVTLDKVGDYPTTLTVTDDKGATGTKTDTVAVTQPGNKFCTSGNANVNNVNIGCVNGNCTSVGIKITCNSKSCQWCDGSDNCGNILYNGVTEIPSGTINCENGQCNYHTQSGGSSSSGSFSCKSNGAITQTTVKVELVNPTVSQSLYQEGDTIKITIPQTAPTGQSQYFGVGLPNESGILVAGNLNEFQAFDGITLPEWHGGETAVDITVTQDFPRGVYNAYLLRSLQGVDPLNSGANQTALGMTSFVIMDEIKVTQITDPNTELGFVGTTGKETIGILGKKDKEGRLIDINRIYFGSQTDTNQNLSITLDDDYLPKTMEFPDGSQIEFSNYTNTGATAIYRNASGNIVNEIDTPLQIDDLYAAAEAIKQFQNSPQPTLNNPVPTVIGTIGSPTDSNCLEIATVFHKGVKSLFSVLFKLASTMSCAVAVGEAFVTGGLAIPAAIWACSSLVFDIAKVIAGDKFEPLIEQVEQGNNLVQGVSSCTVMRDIDGCAQFVASEMAGGALELLKPENVCKGDSSGNCVPTSSFSYCLPRNLALEQWCNENGGFYFDCTESCITDFGTKEEMLERLGQCQALNGYGEDVGFGRVRCTSTLQWCK